MRYWFVIIPAPDIPGVLISHCLNYDVMSQGDSIKDAVDMLKEAVDIALTSDGGLHTLEEYLAPKECWVGEIFLYDNGEVRIPDLSKMDPRGFPLEDPLFERAAMEVILANRKIVN